MTLKAEPGKQHTRWLLAGLTKEGGEAHEKFIDEKYRQLYIHIRPSAESQPTSIGNPAASQPVPRYTQRPHFIQKLMKMCNNQKAHLEKGVAQSRKFA